jgi:hypothetical protein
MEAMNCSPGTGSMPLSAANVGHDFFLGLPDRHLG